MSGLQRRCTAGTERTLVSVAGIVAVALVASLAYVMAPVVADAPDASAPVAASATAAAIQLLFMSPPSVRQRRRRRTVVARRPSNGGTDAKSWCSQFSADDPYSNEGAARVVGDRRQLVSRTLCVGCGRAGAGRLGNRSAPRRRRRAASRANDRTREGHYNLWLAFAHADCIARIAHPDFDLDRQRGRWKRGRSPRLRQRSLMTPDAQVLGLARGHDVQCSGG
jgi:hypothetical protein